MEEDLGSRTRSDAYRRSSVKGSPKPLKKELISPWPEGVGKITIHLAPAERSAHTGQHVDILHALKGGDSKRRLYAAI